MTQDQISIIMAETVSPDPDKPTTYKLTMVDGSSLDGEVASLGSPSYVDRVLAVKKAGATTYVDAAAVSTMVAQVPAAATRKAA